MEVVENSEPHRRTNIIQIILILMSLQLQESIPIILLFLVRFGLMPLTNKVKSLKYETVDLTMYIKKITRTTLRTQSGSKNLTYKNKV